MERTGLVETTTLQNGLISLEVAHSFGPRITSLRLGSDPNLLAELPDFTTTRLDGRVYHFFGGHRLWLAPEHPQRTYAMDDTPVEVELSGEGLLVRKAIEPESSVEKSIQVSLAPGAARVTLLHVLTNRGQAALDCAPWAITQLRTGGVAILPQSCQETGLLPNRLLAAWPYTDLSSPHLSWGSRFLLLDAAEQPPFKLGFPNPRGWLGYWLGGTLFVKRAAFDPRRPYGDFGCSSECYCNRHFLELETLGPLAALEPGASLSHTETWELYPGIARPVDERSIQDLVDGLDLE